MYARHVSPSQCPRCWEPFRDSALQQHLQQDPPCDVQAERKLFDGCTPDQEKMLRSRRKSNPDITEEEKWFKMYKILFPADDIHGIISPCEFYPITLIAPGPS